MGSKNSTSTATPTPTSTSRTDPFDVDPSRSLGLAAAFDGIYHLFGGRVESWNVTEDGLIAQGFSVLDSYDPERILNDVNSHVRRAQLWPTVKWIMGMTPADFESAQDITTFMVQFFKGADESGTSKSPAYVRNAAAAYKASRGGTFTQKRGPKPKSISLKNLADVNESVLVNAGVSAEDIQHLIEIAQKALSERNVNTSDTEATVS